MVPQKRRPGTHSLISVPLTVNENYISRYMFFSTQNHQITKSKHKQSVANYAIQCTITQNNQNQATSYQRMCSVSPVYFFIACFFMDRKPG